MDSDWAGSFWDRVYNDSARITFNTNAFITLTWKYLFQMCRFVEKQNYEAQHKRCGDDFYVHHAPDIYINF